MDTTRRRFLGTAVGAGAYLLAPRSARAADCHVEVLLDEPVGTIAPEIYGHFVEHLGGVVYDGIWVGEGSKIPNVGGIRKEIVDHMKKIRASVVRWPGGCYADQYDWRDGTGARAARPRRTNFWVDAPEWPQGASPSGPQRFEPNHFGTVEFVRFCRLVGAEPYLAANVRSLAAHEFWQWVEYCNSPAGSTTWAERRAADGERDPLRVRFWGVGNESWGCGGNFTPEEYAAEFRRYSAWLPSYGEKLALVGAGPGSGELSWTRGFFNSAEARGRRAMWGWALHHYSWNVTGGRITDWFAGKGDALQFDADQHYELLAEADNMESLITRHWNVMAETDTVHQVKLVVDEWGAWHKPGTEPFREALLGQQNTMRDAVLAGLTLDIFHRHAEKVAMANIAQLVNCLQSLFLAHEDRFCLTPTYHVFDMYAAHQGAQALRTVFAAPRNAYSRNGQPASLYGLNGSASLRDKKLVLTVTNPSLDQPREAQIAVRGGSVRSVRATTLSAPDVHAHNTFAQPRAVEPREETVTAQGAGLAHRFPPASVTKLEIDLG
jgi:alpha-N-arabinofuranosidase